MIVALKNLIVGANKVEILQFVLSLSDHDSLKRKLLHQFFFGHLVVFQGLKIHFLVAEGVACSSGEGVGTLNQLRYHKINHYINIKICSYKSADLLRVNNTRISMSPLRTFEATPDDCYMMN